MRFILPTLAFAVSCSAADLWLAIGYGGRRMVSSDLKTWEITAEWAQPGKDDGNNLMSALWAQGKFVVVGGGGGGSSAAGHILISKDGREWTETHKGQARINPILFGAERFVVGTSSYPSGKLMFSKDAVTWKPGAKIQAKQCTHFRGGAYGNGVFVLTGNGGGISWAIVTKDGETIQSERTDLPGQGTIVFGAGYFFMLTGHGDVDVIRSKDGITWEAVALPEGSKVSWLVKTDSSLIAGNRKQHFITTDGTAWTTQTMNARGQVLWSDGRRFAGSNWPGKMCYTLDGQAWHDANRLSDNGINCVVKVER